MGHKHICILLLIVDIFDYWNSIDIVAALIPAASDITVRCRLYSFDCQVRYTPVKGENLLLKRRIISISLTKYISFTYKGYQCATVGF